jgi:prepilin-type N-terminal cleavage/methylation domain-containing protein
MRNKSKTQNPKSKILGYTLIEVLVAITIFVVIIAGPTGFFISSLKSQRKALSTMEIVDNSSYILEYISRALRMAKKDDLDGISCLSGDKVNYEITYSGQGIKFKNYNGQCQEFYLEGGQLKENKAGNILPITPPDLEVSNLKFQISGEGQADNLQPRVTIFFEIRKKSQPETKIQFQTTISQRNLDVQY